MTQEHRAFLVFFIIVAVLLALAWYGWFTGAWDEAPL